MPPENYALWLPKPGATFEVRPAPYVVPGPGEVVVRVRAVAVNPVDGIAGVVYRFVFPWVTFPTVLGSDVAGDVVEVGSGVTRLHVGDRILGHAAAVERSRTRSAEGAFQNYAMLAQHMVCLIPETLSYEQAAVLPLAVSTAASGMFQQDQLALALPTIDPPDRNATVLVWGGSTSVGSNAIQLARGAGYRVVATASPANFGYVHSLGAAAAVDYRSKTAVSEIVEILDGGALAGTLAIGAGSLSPALSITSKVSGRRRIATVLPTPIARIQSYLQRWRGIHLSLIWGGSLRGNEVGPAIYAHYLPAALANGSYRAAPEAIIVGQGLDQIPNALEQLRKGMSARKLVVRI